MNTFIRLINLPATVRGLTVTDPDGNYNVYINQNLAYEMQLKTVKHESNHIKNNDLYSNEPVIVLESRVNYYKK
ncbi:MAG: hypothetical protein GX996_01550 [Firmicutes bacterium]|nr:hypothetical protein [Bacillota bacterium]